MAAFGNVWNESMNSLVYAAKQEEKKISAGFFPAHGHAEFYSACFRPEFGVVCLFAALGKVGLPLWQGAIS